MDQDHTSDSDPQKDAVPPTGFGAGIPAPSRGRRARASASSAGAGGAAPDAPARPKRRQPDSVSALGRLRDAARGAGAGAPRRPKATGSLIERVTEAVAQCPGPPPGLKEVEAALSRASADGSLARSDLYGYRPHWADPIGEVLARVAVAMDRSAGVLMVLEAATDGRLRDGLESLARSTARHGLEIVVDDHLDAVRGLAAVPDVSLDLSLPISFCTGHGDAFIRIREEAAKSARADSVDLRPKQPIGWFGAGIVEAPTPPLRILEARGKTAYFGVEAPEGLSASGAPDALVLDPNLEPMDAAEAIAEAAFGERVLGGYGADAISRVLIRADRFSLFTECFMEVLEDGLGHSPLAPPPWATQAPGRYTQELDAGLQAARRLGTDEGSTLIFESKRAGRRALVFTNVEGRMRLGGGLKAPAVLALMRG